MKTPEFYWNQDYKIVYESIPEEEGGGFSVFMPELGKYAFVGDGETREEALASLKNVFFHLVNKHLENGDDFPLPRQKPTYSGKFLVRVTPRLHETLAAQAEESGVSLNQYVTESLAASSVGNCTINELEHHFATVNDALVKTAVLTVGLQTDVLPAERPESGWGLQ